MCTSLMSAWDDEALNVEQRIALVMVARSPIDRLLAFKQARGWRHLKLYSDTSGDFTRRDSSIRHFWSGEMGDSTADPEQDSRGAPDLMPLWTILDNTPEGRGCDWYPSLSDEKS